MNSYTFGITGNWWLLVLLLLGAAGLAMRAYIRPVPPLPRLVQAILVFLRWTALSLLIFALFEPVLSLIRASVQQPRLAILWDKSLSMSLRDGSVDRAQAVKQALQAAAPEKLGTDALEILPFSGTVLQGFGTMEQADTVKADGQSTDIARALRVAGELEESRTVQAALLITDGASNTGANPFYEIEGFGRPVYVIAIGDSAEPRDIGIQSLITNELCYLGTTVPITLNIKAAGYPENTELKLSLMDDGSLVEEQKIRIYPGQQAYTATFSWQPSQREGMHRLTARLQGMEGELTQKNNEITEFVRVLKNKRRIALLAGSPNPDISFLRGIIEQMSETELRTFIQKQGSEYYDPAPTEAELQQCESIILMGFPISSTPAAIIQMIEKELARGKPLLFIAGINTDYQKLKPLEKYLPFSVISSRPQEFLASADLRPAGLSNPVMKINGTDQDKEIWNQLPPLFRTETFVKMRPEAEILASLRVNNAPLNEPLIASVSFQGKKTVAVLGYGLYRWKLLGQAADQVHGKNTPDVLSSFFRQSFQWLAASDQEKLVRIRSSKRNYANGEKVEFIAQVYDAGLSPIDNAIINVQVNGAAQPRTVVLQPTGNGVYTAQMAGLPEGEYYYTGTAKVQDRIYGQESGRFTIGASALEYQNLRMNATLLRTLAIQSGGKFYTPATAAAFLEDLRRNPRFVSASISSRNDLALWNLPWLLGAALFCFSLEWFLRKRAGMI
jgi:hypothetical protein